MTTFRALISDESDYRLCTSKTGNVKFASARGPYSVYELI